MTVTAIGVCLVVLVLWGIRRWEQQQWNRQCDWRGEAGSKGQR